MKLVSRKYAHSRQKRRGWARSAISDSLFRNSAFIFGATLANSAIGYAYWGIAARRDSLHTVGEATTLIALFTLISLATNLGIAPVFIRVLPTLSDEDDDMWSAFVITGLLMTAVVAAAAALVACVVLPNLSASFELLRRPDVLCLVMLGAAITSVSAGVDASFISCRSSQHYLMRNVLFSVGKVVLVTIPASILVHISGQTIVVSWVVGLTVSTVFGVAVLFPKVRPGFHFHIRGGIQQFTSQWRLLIGSHLTTVGGVIVPFVLPLLVAGRISVKSDAIFYLTWTVGSVFFIISPAIASSLFAEGSNGSNLSSDTRKAVKFIIMILVPLIAIFVCLSRNILGLFGSQYAERGSTLLIILALSSIPDAVTNVAVSVYQVTDRLRLSSALNVGMGVITIGLTYWLIPRYQLDAPGIAFLSAQVVGCAVVLVIMASRWKRASVVSVHLGTPIVSRGPSVDERMDESAFSSIG